MCMRSMRQPASRFAEFGTGGRIDLREGLGRDPRAQSVLLTTPGVIYQGPDDRRRPRQRGAAGVAGRHPRATTSAPARCDGRFHTIPHPGELGYDTWPNDAWTYTGGANNWAGMALDERARHRLRAHRIGGGRLLRRQSARRQPVRELAARARRRDRQAPLAFPGGASRHLGSRFSVAAERSSRSGATGRRIDAVAQTTKHGYVFLFDRANGKPLFPIEYRTFPASTCEAKRPRRRSRCPTKPAPFARQMLTEDMLTTRTPEAHRWALEQFRDVPQRGQFVPFSVGHETVIFPGFDGGAEWGGSAFDPETGLLYVNANEMAWTGAHAETEPSGRPSAVPAELRRLPPRRLGAPPQFPRSSASRDRRPRAESPRSSGRARHGCPAFPNLSPGRGVTRVVDLLRTGESENAGRRRRQSRARAMKYRFTGYNKFLDPDGLSGGRAAMGHVERHQPEHRRVRVEDSARRISGAGREGDEEHRQRELRRAGCHGRRAGLHRRDELRSQVPRVRQGDGRAALGDDAAVFGQRDAVT